jgi:hypothetical protein
MALIDKKLTELTEKLSVPDDAFIHIVDVSDTSQSPEGSSYKARKSTISGTVKAQTGVSGTVKTNSNSSDPIVYLKSEVDSLVEGKQDTIGFTPENIINKQSNLDEDLTGLKYPNVTAVRNGLSDKASLADLFLKADKSSTYTKAEVDNIIASITPNIYIDRFIADGTTNEFTLPIGAIILNVHVDRGFIREWTQVDNILTITLDLLASGADVDVSGLTI